jgi:hypothetical protein
LGLLLQSFPKEIVYYLLIDAVRFTEADGTIIEYKNDPTAGTSACPQVSYATYDPSYAGSDKEYVSPYHPPGDGKFADLTNCRYERFIYWIETGIAYGLSIEYASIPNPKYDPNDSKGTQPKTIVSGRFCLDPAQARPDLVDQIKHLPTSLCDQQPKMAAAPAKQAAAAKPVKAKAPAGGHAAPRTVTNATQDEGTELAFPFTRNGRMVLATLGFRMRPLIGAFTYLGQLLSRQDTVVLYNASAQSNGDRRLLTATPATDNANCFAFADLGNWCVPEQGGDNTKRVFSLLAELIQLNSTASDTPTSLTVRLTP